MSTTTSSLAQLLDQNTREGELCRPEAGGAVRIGQQAGLRYVYAGNLPGLVGGFENTYCPQCRALMVERAGYRILQYRLTDQIQ